ncbi:MAG: TetR/AcrR family transcriptional regulator [Vallitaleaceae bacterium]|jgi:AcrR family transcriptional regulator|nr:TetR/AcrR family transcriptional regulator [Vallitaleaceae bacterium]
MQNLSSKERLIKATVEAIYENGLHSVTTAKIAKKAELSEAMIYKHFGSKDDMIVETFMSIKEALNSAVEASIDTGKSYEAQCYDVWLGHIVFFVEHEAYLRMIAQFEQSNYMTEAIRTTCLVKISTILNLFEKGIELGVFKPAHIEIVSAFFFAPILALSDSFIHKRLVMDEATLKLAFDSTMKALG